MAPRRLCIMTCDLFREEAEQIVASADFDSVSVATYPSRCGRPLLTPDDIFRNNVTFDAFDTIHLFGSCCLAGLDTLPSGNVRCTITRFGFCKELITAHRTVSDLVASGGYLVTPGWLKNWPEHVAEWGFTHESAREFFAECSRQIVLLDTGIRAEAADELADFAVFVDRPYSTVPVGLDMMRLRMQLCRERWLTEQAESAVQLTQQRFSEYAMAFDLLSTLARCIDEDDVIRQTLNMYQMLFAASDTAFIRFHDGTPSDVVTNGFARPDDLGSLFDEAAALKGEYAVLSEDGFLLNVRLGERTLGVVRITGIALPRYMDIYLNLALATIEVCGLALTNAIRYREVADKNHEIEAAHLLLKNRHRQMLEQEKMASIGHLAAGVAHEINNPMGFITSNLGSLHKYVTRIIEYAGIAESGGDLASARSRLKIDYVLGDAVHLIEESLDGAKRVRNIVNDLKALSRCERSEPVATDLNRCVESALNIAGNEIKYVADIERQFGAIPNILCHPEQLSQVFINLLTNAGQALSDHGVITIRTWCDGENVFVSVADTGAGIPEEIRTHIFDPFFTTKDVGKGTGLGLAISYDIVQKHNGEIWVDSEVGRGTQFTVRIPIAGS